tara:strand:- start:19353 stop:20327 length:975 start_codon:yes stop_codon:yes gene_type:complete
MALETGTYINSLNASNPVSTDAIAAADDHLRLIKSTILATFPSLTGAVTTTQAELNIIDGGTAATSTTLASADRIVVNDNGTMVQVALSDLLTYLNSFQTAAGALATISSGGNAVTMSGLAYPSADGSADQFLKTNGSGTLSFGVPAGTFSMPPGVIFPYAGGSAPTGYLLCDGSAVNTYDQRLLHAVVSNTYGGTAHNAGVTDQSGVSTTFNLPDLRGRVVAGKGSGSNLTTPDQTTLGATGGSKEHDLQLTEIPGHTHDAGTLSTGITVHTGGSGTVNVMSTSNSGGITSAQAVSGSTASAGGGNAHNNVQPTIILNYVIKT